jgi:outer membrane protein TolC
MPSPWLSLGLSVLAAGGATAFAAVRGLSAYRAVKRLARETGETVSDIERSAAEIESRLAAGAGRSDELAGALARLHASRAQLDVLLGALAEVRDSLGRVTAFVPRK